MEYLCLDVRFTGPSNFDQPYRILGQFQGKHYSDEIAMPVSLSRSTIPDPRMLLGYAEYDNIEVESFLAFFARPGKFILKLEHEAALDFYDFLNSVHKKENRTSGEKICWLGNFCGYTTIHQIRAFLFRHGFIPYFGKGSVVCFDTSYLRKEMIESLASDEDGVEMVLSLVEMIEEEKENFVKLSGPFWAAISAFPPSQKLAFRGSEETGMVRFWENFPRPHLYESCFLPLGTTKGGILLLDLHLLSENSFQPTKFEDLSQFLIWVNSSASVFFRSNKVKPEDRKKFNIKQSANLGNTREAMEEYRNIAKIVMQNLEGVDTSPSAYFKMLERQNAGVDSELLIYDLDVRNVYLVRNAIYHDNVDSLVSHRDTALYQLYTRHLARVHNWSGGTYKRSTGSEDVDAKKVLQHYCKVRYTDYGRNPVNSPPPTTLNNLFSMLDASKISSEFRREFRHFLAASDAVLATVDAAADKSYVRMYESLSR